MDDVETLNAEIDELESSIAKLGEDIAEITAQIAETDAAMAKATNLRNEEKAKNAETVDDAEKAQTAVAQALVVLKEFYAKAAESTALVQKKEKQHKEPGILEVIQSDFARLETDTRASEAQAQQEYDEFMT